MHDNHTDAPLIPVGSLERLHRFRPDLIDWVITQTQTEAEARRSEQRRINTLEFAERVLGMFCAVVIGGAGIGGGIYAAIQGHDWLGGIVASITIGTLAVNFLRNRGARAK